MAVPAGFFVAWVIALLATLHVNIGGQLWLLFKLSLLVILPLCAMRRGLTHIRVGQGGLRLESASGKRVLRKTDLPWTRVKRVYLEPAAPGRPLLGGKLVIQLDTGKKVVPLKKIAIAGEWRKLVTALQQQSHGVLIDLDIAYLDSLSAVALDGPSYTKLWLEALTAPPRRERLLPLTAGTELQSGRFKIESKLGMGGQGSAYLARQVEGQLVVLKEYILPVYVDRPVRKQAIDAFQHEASTLSTLKDRHIVQMIDSFIEDQRAYLVLEYVRGSSLRQLVKTGGLVSESLCLKMASEMCAALTYLHERTPPVVHQDFTPDNLIVDESGALKLIDFMVAKQLAADDSETSTVVGKHHYMPPEQFRGQATRQSDLYALGCTLYFLLTAEDPEPMSEARPILKNASVSGELDALIAKATQLDLSRRYKSAKEIQADLDNLDQLRVSVSSDRELGL